MEDMKKAARSARSEAAQQLHSINTSNLIHRREDSKQNLTTGHRLATLNEDPLLRPPEAARYLGLSASTLAKKRLDGSGPRFYKITNRLVAYRMSELCSFVESRGRSSTSDSGAA